MKPKDLIALLYFGAITAFLVFQTDLFVWLTKTYPYPMGFAKIALLATFGECLRHRISSGNWIPGKIGIRFLIWGLLGLWFTAAFPFTDAGVKGITTAGLWPTSLRAFWMSCWINLLSGYAFFMMFFHYWADIMLANNRFCWPWEVLGMPETKRWGKIVFCSIFFFWIPAHTLTFSLPPVWRVICAAYLAVCLGIILSFASAKHCKCKCSK